MAGLVGFGCTGQLWIGDGDMVETPMNTTAWDITNLTPLWAEFSVRGQDRRLPGVNGVIPYRRRFDITEHDLQMVIIGDADMNGNANSNAWIGLEENITFLREFVIDPPNPPGATGQKSARLVMPSGEERFANIHVLGLRLSETQGIGEEHAFCLAALKISIPQGVFIPA
jgi:hypothetical protein